MALVPVGSGGCRQGAPAGGNGRGVSMMADVPICEGVSAAPAGSAPHGEGPVYAA